MNYIHWLCGLWCQSSWLASFSSKGGVHLKYIESFCIKPRATDKQIIIIQYFGNIPIQILFNKMNFIHNLQMR